METRVILKRTPLFPIYQNYGGKAIDFGGWELPVQFGGIIQEHEAVRKQAGLFDVSHMGEVEIETPVQIGIRGKRVEAKVVRAPFYKREK